MVASFLHLQKNREVLGRVVLMLHRDLINVESLTVRRGKTPFFLHTALTPKADRDRARRL
jgi:hypothetical protein